MQMCDLEIGPEIDRDVMAMLIDETGPEIVIELIGMFFDETAARQDRMQARFAAKDITNLAREAHALVSSAAQFGGHAASDAALRLELAARTGADVGPLLADLDQQLAALVVALAAFRTRLS